MPSATPRQLAHRKAFGVRVREERLKRGITQEQLVHQAELDRSYVGRVERGERNVSLDNIYRLANALSIEADSLV